MPRTFVMRRHSAAIHERLAREERSIGSSDRSFGALFAVVFTIGGAWPLLQGDPIRSWCFVVASIFLTLAVFRPRTLAPLNRLWLGLGLALHACTNPVIMAVLYYTTVTPIALFLRLLRKDLLRLRFEPASATYWIERQPPGPAPDTMPRQF